jgi:hypothetical protein
MNGKNLNFNTVNHDEWLTPKYITDELGPFDLDPCSPIVRPWNTALNHINKLEDGLSSKWFGMVWLNPPYGKEAIKWMSKLKDNGDGIALIFARTDTKLFQENVLVHAQSMFLIKGRIRFCFVDGTSALENAGAPSVLIAYGKKADANLLSISKKQTIKGVYIKLN